MADSIDFKDLFIELNLDPIPHSGNLTCPFCDKKAFKPYDDGRAHCHNCNWHGDAVQLYADLKGKSRQDAYTTLAELYGLGRIHPAKKTYEQARDSLANDLEFLSWCRMYFAFYRNQRSNMTYYQQKSGLSPAQFSKIVNGQFDLVSRKTWNMVVLMLKQSLDIRAFKSDIKHETGFWKQHISENGLNEAVGKFQ